MSPSPAIIRRRAERPSELPETYPLLLRRVLASRQITRSEQLRDSLADLPSPFLLKGMEQAVERLWLAYQQQQRIVVVGDYDADGATSVAVLLHGLQQLGFQQVQFVVPDRFRFGYGLSCAIVEQVTQLKPQLIITVDNGIASIDGVALAKQLGMDVIVTDHHLPGAQLPDALAIVNPNQPDCSFPSKAIAGVGVAFYLLMALRHFFRRQAVIDQHTQPNLAELLDLVALGTVADVVPLDWLNRVFVQQGIKRIRAGKARAGIRQLIKLAGKQENAVSSSDIAFALAPRLNAAGRLDDMSQGIMLLLTESDELAFELASLLDEFNRDRRVIEQQMQDQALAIVQTIVKDDDVTPRGLCLFQEDWHQGVVGLVASRVKERLYCPVIAFAQGDDGLLKGSGRSIQGIHLRDVLDAVATKHPDLLTRFGGHAMAAGLSLHKQHLPAFRQAFLAELTALEPSLFEAQVLTDGVLQAQDLNIYVAQCLRDIPWGQGLPEPLFEGQFYIHQATILKEKHIKWLLSLDNRPEQAIPAVLFQAQAQDFACMQQEKVSLVYRLAINYFRGEQTLQLIVERAHWLNSN